MDAESEFITVSSKGQIVIPAKFRQALKIKAGTRVSVHRSDGHLVLQPITGDYIDSLVGILGDTSDLMQSLLRDREEEEID